MNPDDGMTVLAQYAVQLHEFYSTLVRAGFSEQQAFDLTQTWVRVTAAQGGAS